MIRLRVKRTRRAMVKEASTRCVSAPHRRITGGSERNARPACGRYLIAYERVLSSQVERARLDLDRAESGGFVPKPCARCGDRGTRVARQDAGDVGSTRKRRTTPPSPLHLAGVRFASRTLFPKEEDWLLADYVRESVVLHKSTGDAQPRALLERAGPPAG